MINWTEEDVKFVMNSMIIPCVEELMKFNDISHESYSKMLHMMANRIRELDYERQRDKSFFLSFLGKIQMYSSEDIVRRAYDIYCEKYDKLNKHLLNNDKKWFSPNEKMPNIGDRIIVQDWSGEEMEVVFDSFPTDVKQSNVCKWRYINE
jgi:hypothetical protein